MKRKTFHFLSGFAAVVLAAGCLLFLRPSGAAGAVRVTATIQSAFRLPEAGGEMIGRAAFHVPAASLGKKSRAESRFLREFAMLQSMHRSA